MAPDPLDVVMAREERMDHAQAERRGQRVRDLAEAVVAALMGPGLLPAAHRAQAVIVAVHILADDLYGNAALDLPADVRSVHVLKKLAGSPR